MLQYTVISVLALAAGISLLRSGKGFLNNLLASIILLISATAFVLAAFMGLPLFAAL